MFGGINLLFTQFTINLGSERCPLPKQSQTITPGTTSPALSGDMSRNAGNNGNDKFDEISLKTEIQLSKLKRRV